MVMMRTIEIKMKSRGKKNLLQMWEAPIRMNLRKKINKKKLRNKLIGLKVSFKEILILWWEVQFPEVLLILMVNFLKIQDI
jgi:hypothetical protein